MLDFLVLWSRRASSFFGFSFGLLLLLLLLLANILKVLLRLLLSANLLGLRTLFLLLCFLHFRIYDSNVSLPLFEPVGAHDVINLICLFGHKVELKILKSSFHIFFLLLPTYIALAWRPNPVNHCVVLVGRNLLLQSFKESTEWRPQLLIGTWVIAEIEHFFSIRIFGNIPEKCLSINVERQAYLAGLAFQLSQESWAQRNADIDELHYLHVLLLQLELSKQSLGGLHLVPIEALVCDIRLDQ